MRKVAVKTFAGGRILNPGDEVPNGVKVAEQYLVPKPKDEKPKDEKPKDEKPKAKKPKASVDPLAM